MLTFIVILVSSAIVGLLVQADIFFKILATSNRLVVVLFFITVGLLSSLLSLLISKIEKRKFLFVLVGIIAGAFFSWFMGELFFADSIALRLVVNFSAIIFAGFYSYHLAIVGFSLSKNNLVIASNYKILDTSVIVDARIADVVEAGFLEGSLVVPEFVLKELQGIADSKDNVRRNRGRYGLDILNRLKDLPTCNLVMSANAVKEQEDVDHKLLVLTKELNGVLLTVDYNLNKIAHLKGVPVLNINELANALKPNVVVGDSINIMITKNGKEPEQGVGYFDDGTMVVIEDGHDYIGKSVSVAVTSVFQTDAGRMIFSCIDNK